MLTINDTITIDSRYLQISFVRSRGPGGQNVNKVSTAAQLTFDLPKCPDLAAPVKKRLSRLAGRRVNTQGKIIIHADCFRSQNRNRTECLDRLRRLIEKALVTPKKRLQTKPSPAAKNRRLQEKKQHSKIKTLRRETIPDQ